MNEFDITKLHGLKINIKWSTVAIITTIFANSVFWSFKFGNYFTKQETRNEETRKITEDNKNAINVLRADVNSIDKTVATHTVEITNLKKQN